MSDYLTVREICNRLPGSRGARHLNPATVTRWILSGVSTPSGRIRLPATRVGSRWLIPEAEFGKFLRTVTEHALPEPAVPTPPITTSESHRRADAASRQLAAKYGI